MKQILETFCVIDVVSDQIYADYPCALCISLSGIVGMVAMSVMIRGVKRRGKRLGSLRFLFYTKAVTERLW